MNINLFENLLERYQDILDISPDQIQILKVSMKTKISKMKLNYYIIWALIKKL